AALGVRDFNGDGRDDVVQLHRATREFSVRLAKNDGSLHAPKFYPIGTLPNQMGFSPNSRETTDVNNDGLSDVVAVSLGQPGIERAAVCVRLGKADGTFE